MFKPTKKQVSAVIGSTVLIGMVAILAYAAVIFTPGKQPIGYVGQPTLSNYNVTSGNSQVYRGMYNLADWSGQFTCYPVNSVGYVDLNAPCFPSGASSPLDIQAASGVRLIGTLSDSSTAPAGVEFSTAASPIGLTSSQQATLGGATNINWLRGTSLSPTGLRARTTVLGDIVHSSPYYYTDGTNPTVFMGANDGMLHAFNATTGAERWAFVPSMLIPKMSALTSASYSHDYFVDGGVTINTKVPIAGTNTPVLVGALGAGGKGLYALNISSLTAISGQAVGQKALWEITPSSITYNGTRTTFTCTAGAATAPTGSYCNMGNTYSNPVIVPTEDGSTAVIVGNGYNNTGNGHATLYIINAQNGSLIREIDTGSGSTTSPNGLSSPTAVDTTGNGKADRVYAGDINGNMWVFNLSSASPSAWTSAYGTPPSSSPQPLFSIPQGAASEPIAITQAPAVSVHPYGGFMLNFATGRILSGPLAAVNAPSTTAAIDDTADTNTPYAAYGLWDNLSTTIASGSLITQTLSTTTYSSLSVGTVPVVNETTNNLPVWTGATPNRGWTVPLKLQGGERVIGDGGYVDSGKFQFNVSNPTVTYTPSGSSTGSTGLNWLFDLDYLTGGPGTTAFVDMNQDGLINTADLIGNGTSTAASAIPVAYVTSNGVQSQPILIQLAGARIALYNQNYNLPSTGPTSGTGVNGGHFDVDVFYNCTTNTGNCNSTGFQFISHVHEYDKIYDTNGLNPLNPNDQNYPLSTVQGMTATTPYKVLVMNQAWNRAMNLRIGTWSGSTRDYQTGLSTDVFGVSTNASSTYYDKTKCASTVANATGCLKVGNLPQYTGTSSTVKTYSTVPNTSTTDIAGKIRVLTVSTTGTIGCTNALGVASGVCGTSTPTSGPRASVGGLELSMPFDGFDIRDWWADGDGVIQTGVMPITPQCAFGDAATSTTYPGLNGERHDGVLTLQIINASTPASDVQMNVPGQPIYGFRVIDSKINTDVYAEYTLYWHHPNAECMGNTQTWKTVNNPGDPWWPAEEVWTPGVAASCTSGYVSTSGGGSCKACPIGQSVKTGNTCSGGGQYQTIGAYTAATGFFSSTTKSSSSIRGTLTCVVGGPSNASGTSPKWNVSTPPTAYTAANTSPYGGALGSSAAGPAGWTITPPQDSATTLPICPTYSSVYDDPRTASFINSSSGANGTGGTSGVPATSIVTSGMGGVAYSDGVTPPSNSGGGTTTASGVSTVTGGVTNIQQGAMPTAHRITWRELIGL